MLRPVELSGQSERNRKRGKIAIMLLQKPLGIERDKNHIVNDS